MHYRFFSSGCMCLFRCKLWDDYWCLISYMPLRLVVNYNFDHFVHICSSVAFNEFAWLFPSDEAIHRHWWSIFQLLGIRWLNSLLNSFLIKAIFLLMESFRNFQLSCFYFISVSQSAKGLSPQKSLLSYVVIFRVIHCIVAIEVSAFPLINPQSPKTCPSMFVKFTHWPLFLFRSEYISTIVYLCYGSLIRHSIFHSALNLFVLPG